MPVPTPQSDESEDDFVSRCMGDDAMQEYDQEQRAAICYSTYRDRSATPEAKMNERLAELRRARAKALDRMKEIQKQDDETPEDQPLAPDLQAEFAALSSLVESLNGRLARLEEVMTLDATAANDEADDEPIGNGSGDEAAFQLPVVAHGGQIRRGGLRIYARPKGRPKQTGPGFQVARFMIGLAHKRWNGVEKAAQFIENRFGDGEVAKALTYSVVAEGGALIPQDFMADLIELLRAVTVVRGAGPTTVGMPMGNLTIPRLAGGATAGYQGELDDIALTQEAFDDVNLFAKKLTAMVPVSNDLIRRAPIGVEEIVRDDLVQTIARREDLAFLRGDGAGKSPIGWRSLCLPANLIALPAPAADEPARLTQVVDGLSSLMLRLVNGMSRMIRPHWFMAPTTLRYIATRRDSVGGFYYKDEVATGMIEGIPWSYTQQIPTNLGAGTNGSEIYLVDMADTLIGDTMNLQVDASDVAAYWGTANDAGEANVVSAFQRDQTVFRVISEHDFNMRHLQSLAIATTTNWLPNGTIGLPGAPWSTQRLNPTWAQAPAAWPADAANPDPAPTLWTPALAMTSAFDGPLTDRPGGNPRPPLAGDDPDGAPPPPPAPETPEPHRGRPRA
jgi:HK97 family phage major capsid protein